MQPAFRHINDMPPALRFGMVVDQICKFLLAQSFRAPALFLLLHHRARRTQRRFAALAARIAAGEVLPPLQRRVLRPRDAAGAEAAEAADAEAASRPPPPRIPSAFCWLSRLIPAPPLGQGFFLGGCNSALHDFLQSPTLQPVMAAAPDRVGRLLRPLARMFGTVLPEALRLPKRARRPRPRIAKPRAAAPRPSRRKQSIPRLCDPLPADLPPAPVVAPAPPAAPSPPVAPPSPAPEPSWPPLPPGYIRVRVQHICGEVRWVVLRRSNE